MENVTQQLGPVWPSKQANEPLRMKPWPLDGKEPEFRWSGLVLLTAGLRSCSDTSDPPLWDTLRKSAEVWAGSQVRLRRVSWGSSRVEMWLSLRSKRSGPQDCHRGQRNRQCLWNTPEHVVCACRICRAPCVPSHRPVSSPRM